MALQVVTVGCHPEFFGGNKCSARLNSAVFQLSDGIQVVVLGALRGIQDVKIPAVITFVAYWVIGFPTSWYLSKVAGMGAMGIWIGLLAGLTAAAIFLYLRFNYLTKKMIKGI